MISLPFYLPDKELDLRLCQICLLLEVLSFNQKGNPVLTIDKIALFEFIGKHPLIINNILSRNHREIVEYNSSEIYSIEAVFPNRSKLYNYDEIKKILLILHSYGFVKIRFEGKMDIFFTISEEGSKFAVALDSSYFKRLGKIYKKLYPIKSQPFSKLNQLVEYYISYTYENKDS